MKQGGNLATHEWKDPFPVTHWTEILDARSEKQPCRQAALEQLLGRYWKPVYCYLRSKGYGSEEAQDLTQAFFHEVVLGRRLIQRADRAKGKFRAFLLRALHRYAADVHRAERAKQRVPEGGLISLERVDAIVLPEPVRQVTPDEAFDYAWASALVDQVLQDVAAECRQEGKTSHWEVFRARVLLPIMDGAESPPLRDLCVTYGISNETNASKMTIAVKRRFRDILRRRVRQFVGSDDQIDNEIGYLMRVFSKRPGRF